MTIADVHSAGERGAAVSDQDLVVIAQVDRQSKREQLRRQKRRHRNAGAPEQPRCPRSAVKLADAVDQHPGIHAARLSQDHCFEKLPLAVSRPLASASKI